jgi:hypothetical protein
MDDIERYNFWHKELPEYKAELDVNKVVRSTFNKYLVKHVPIKNDDRCRTEIMFEEMTSEVMKILKGT